MREFYVWTKHSPYYRGPYELDDAIEIAKESAYISQDKADDMRRQYIKGESYDWRFQCDFSELAEITVSPPKPLCGTSGVGIG